MSNSNAYSYSASPRNVLDAGAILAVFEHGADGQAIRRKVPAAAFQDENMRDVFACVVANWPDASVRPCPYATMDALNREEKNSAAGTVLRILNYEFGMPAAWYSGTTADAMLNRYSDVLTARAKRRMVSELQSGIDEPTAMENFKTAMATIDALCGRVRPLTAMDDLRSLEADAKASAPMAFGIPCLDDAITIPKNLVVIGAAPASGKTSFALSVAMNMVHSGRRVGYVALEEDSVGITVALLARLSGVSNRAIRTQQFVGGEAAAVHQAAMDVGSAQGDGRLCVVHGPASTTTVAGYVSRLVESRNLDAVFVDHLHQLRREGSRDEHRALGDAVLGLQRACIGKFPLFLLSQLNRASRSEGRAPSPHDLRGSGDIEQAARAVILLHRQVDQDGLPVDPSHVQAKVAKVTSGGRVGEFKLAFDGARNWAGQCRCATGQCGWRAR